MNDTKFNSNKQIDDRNYEENIFDESEKNVIRVLSDKRKARGMTQKELSDITGITQSDISKIESGKSNPTLKNLQRLADALGMQIKVEILPRSDNSENVV